jgi:hypothetical protein
MLDYKAAKAALDYLTCVVRFAPVGGPPHPKATSDLRTTSLFARSTLFPASITAFHLHPNRHLSIIVRYTLLQRVKAYDYALRLLHPMA